MGVNMSLRCAQRRKKHMRNSVVPFAVTSSAELVSFGRVHARELLFNFYFATKTLIVNVEE